MSTTLHWFYSLGIANKSATYTFPLDTLCRFRGLFPSVVLANKLCERTIDAHSTTMALLQLLGPLDAAVDLKLHLLATPETSPGSAPHRLAAEDCPTWARPNFHRNQDPHTAFSRDPDSIQKIVAYVLDQVSDGDAVVIDSTGGLRPFTTATMLSHPVISAMRPTVRMAAMVYAEFGAPTVVHDLTAVMDLPSWAVAGASLSRRFDARPLADIVRTQSPALAEGLERMATALDFGWPGDWIDAATEVSSALNASPGPEIVLSALQRGIDSLRPFPTSPTLTLERVLFHFSLVKLLIGAGRHGTAVRVLRESMVDAALLCIHGEGYADWRKEQCRDDAERRLFFSKDPLQEHWKAVTSLRNAASHAKANVKHEGLPNIAEVITPKRIDEIQQSILPDNEIAPELFAAKRPGVFWFSVAPLPTDWSTVESKLQPPSSQDPGAESVHPERDRRMVSIEATPAARGSNWCFDKAKRARDFSHAVLVGLDPTTTYRLVKKLRRMDVQCWTLSDGRLWPLSEDA
jgi:hypothetical protein